MVAVRPGSGPMTFFERMKAAQAANDSSTRPGVQETDTLSAAANEYLPLSQMNFSGSVAATSLHNRPPIERIKSDVVPPRPDNDGVRLNRNTSPFAGADAQSTQVPPTPSPAVRVKQEPEATPTLKAAVGPHRKTVKIEHGGDGNRKTPITDPLVLRTPLAIGQGIDMTPTVKSESTAVSTGYVAKPDAGNATSSTAKLAVPAVEPSQSSSLTGKSSPMRIATASSVRISSRVPGIKNSAHPNGNGAKNDKEHKAVPDLGKDLATPNGNGAKLSDEPKAVPDPTKSLTVPTKSVIPQITVTNAHAMPGSLSLQHGGSAESPQTTSSEGCGLRVASCGSSVASNSSTPSLNELLAEVREAQASSNRNTFTVLDYEERFKEIEWRLGHLEKIMNVEGHAPFSVVVKLPNGQSFKIEGIMAHMKLAKVLYKVRETTIRQFINCAFVHNGVVLRMSERVGDSLIRPSDTLYLVDDPSSSF